MLMLVLVFMLVFMLMLVLMLVFIVMILLTMTVVAACYSKRCHQHIYAFFHIILCLRIQ